MTSESGTQTDSEASDPEAKDNERTITLYWRPGCGFCMNLERQLKHRGVEYERVNIWDDPEAAGFVRSVARGNETVPTVRVRSLDRTFDRSLVNPGADEVLALVSSGD